MEKISNLLIDKYDNHIMPFLWMHGEDEETIKEYIQKIYQSGIRSVCIESRPHEEFLKDKWWKDLDIIIAECEKRDMTIWILDDEHFPTGYAAGEIEKNHKNLQKKYLNFHQFDFIGPKKNAGMILDWAISAKRPDLLEADQTVEESLENKVSSEIVSVVAAKKKRYKEIFEEELIDITANIKDKTLYWDIPEGEWSIFVFYTTIEGGESATEGYLNPLVPEATDVLLKTVYEPHYARYSTKFGGTIQGFFSDEPRFGNTKGPDAVVGKTDMPLPWSDRFLTQFSNKISKSESEVRRTLPLLFRGISMEAKEYRAAYMDLVSDLYSQNFSQRIGDWCESHGVDYIGHVIEDNNAHSRLGYGAGHFFKSMKGQTMAGIDIVLHQLLPNYGSGYFKSMTSTGWDGEFFHYGLAKMGASLGHLDPNKQGRTMCEVFGAYGWSEGTKLMKWITDHMLVRGVNYFVPHAFSMKDFPDPDCPPHFYAHGKNPQFQGFRILMDYMNRLSYLLSEGHHVSDVAVLYHAEAEWLGEYMPFQKITKILLENQYEFEVVSSKMIEDSKISAESFAINEYDFKTLIIPYSEYLPINLLKRLKQMMEQNIQVIFIEELPKSTNHEFSFDDDVNLSKEKVHVVQLSALTDVLSKSNVDQIILNKHCPELRYYHYKHGNKSIFMLFNEDDKNTLQCEAAFPINRLLQKYDPLSNKVEFISTSNGVYDIQLGKAESLVLFETDDDLQDIQATNTIAATLDLTNHQWLVKFNGINRDQMSVSDEVLYDSLPLLGQGDQWADFAGTISYSTKYQRIDKKVSLQLANASEVVTVYVNNELIDRKISTPYHFDLGTKLNQEENEIRIEVTNNLGRNLRDYLSQYLLLEPLGIIGDVTLSLHAE